MYSTNHILACGIGPWSRNRSLEQGEHEDKFKNLLGQTMKIILTTISPSIDSEIDPRFGRCAYLLLVDLDTLDWQAFPNPGASAPGGAGIQAAQFVCNQGAEAVISGDFGPHAYQALNAANLPMYIYGASGTAQQVIERFKAGKLQRVGAPTRGEGNQGHSGVG